MKYFIDFEASLAPIKRITSVGCIDESGREFYSVVHHNVDELSPGYCELKDISLEEFQNAPTIDKVFSMMFDWIECDDSVEFYCYGGADLSFVDCAIKEVTSFKARCMLYYLRRKMDDFATTVSNHFHTITAIALTKVVNYYRASPTVQTHNSLDDAKLLREIYYCVQAEGNIKASPFPEYQKTNEYRLPCGCSRISASGTKKKYRFNNYLKAARYFTNHRKAGVTEEHYDELLNLTVKNIKNAVETKSLFMGMSWKLEYN